MTGESTTVERERHDAPPAREHGGVPPGEPDSDLDQIVERLSWTPLERLRYLLDMLAFEERARRARLVTRRG